MEPSAGIEVRSPYFGESSRGVLHERLASEFCLCSEPLPSGNVALLASGLVTAAGKGAPTSEPGIVETFSEPFRGGADPVASQLEMNDLNAWLWAERAATPADPGISVSVNQQDRIDMGEEPCADCDGRLMMRPGKMRVGVVKGIKTPVAFRNFSPGSLKGSLLVCPRWCTTSD